MHTQYIFLHHRKTFQGKNGKETNVLVLLHKDINI